MPNRQYIPRNSPPSRFDHLMAHIGLVVMLVWQLGTALLTAVGDLIGYPPALDTDGLPFELFRYLIAFMVVLGSIMTLTGVLSLKEEPGHVWRRLKGGLTLLAGAWPAYIVSLLIVNPAALQPIWSATMNSVLAGAALWVVIDTEKRTRDASVRVKRFMQLGGS